MRWALKFCGDYKEKPDFLAEDPQCFIESD